MKITAEDILRLLVRTAQHFLGFAWEMLGEKKKIIEVKQK
jgi:hypothetical protein